ncbi:hypothetical protein [Methylobacterium sp. J-090]|uniref:hypothetical protein n=1 Tax=Methylobacterium sp. J-090 TaxID=2836666 RepID=UPI001FBB4150|nr:hypothetical protein [Methylobacterium sp. J-090]MCJ2083928.1 hypothetical protein [Methylobacterium sp. J-090]
MSDDLSGSRHDGSDRRPPRYRAILLGPTGRIASLVNLIAGDDKDALRLAEAMVDGHAVELWDGVRFIEHFPALDPEGEASAKDTDVSLATRRMQAPGP